jgi:hypothetical protein
MFWFFRNIPLLFLRIIGSRTASLHPPPSLTRVKACEIVRFFAIFVSTRPISFMLWGAFAGSFADTANDINKLLLFFL